MLFRNKRFTYIGKTANYIINEERKVNKKGSDQIREI